MINAKRAAAYLAAALFCLLFYYLITLLPHINF